MSWYQRQGEKLIIYVAVQAGTRQDAVIGIVENRLKIKLSSPAIEGKANQKLLQLLSNLFKVPKTSLKMLSGEKNPYKRIEIKNCKLEREVILQNLNLHS